MSLSQKSTPTKNGVPKDISELFWDTDDNIIHARPTKVTKFQRLTKQRIETCMDDSFMKEFGIIRTDSITEIEYSLRDCHLSTNKQVNNILQEFYNDAQVEMLSYSGLKPLEWELTVTHVKNLYTHLIKRNKATILK